MKNQGSLKLHNLTLWKLGCVGILPSMTSYQ